MFYLFYQETMINKGCVGMTSFMKRSTHFIISLLLAVGFSKMAQASCVEDFQDSRSFTKNNPASVECYISKLIEQFPHDPLFVKDYSEETLINNWLSLRSNLRSAQYFKKECSEELSFQQERKMRKLKNLFSYTLSSALSPELYEKAEYVAFVQVCSFKDNSPEKIAQTYEVSESVLRRYFN